MADAIGDIIAARSREPEGLQKMIVWSAAAHAVVIGVLLVAPMPQAHEEPRLVMSISLGGAEGPATGGLTQIGGREVPPAPALPEDPLPSRQAPTPPPAAQPAMTLPAPEPPRPQPPRPPPQTQQRAPQPQRPPQPSGPTPIRVPFREQQQQEPPRPGSTTVDTGATGRGTGLSSGGGGGGGIELDVRGDFCCPDYLLRMRDVIRRNWNQHHGIGGRATVRFTINRDGTIANIGVDRPSGHFALDSAAERALLITAEQRQMAPLPAEFPNPTLTVYLTFEYH